MFVCMVCLNVCVFVCVCVCVCLNVYPYRFDPRLAHVGFV